MRIGLRISTLRGYVEAQHQ